MANYVKIAPHALMLLGFIALGAGGVGGFVLTDSVRKSPVVPDDATNVVNKVTVTVPDTSAIAAKAEVERLRQRIGELEKLLDEREAAIKTMLVDTKPDTPGTSAPAEEPKPERPRWERLREEREARLERMKTEDPEAYAAEMKRREEWQKRQEEWRARIKAENDDRNSFLASIDTDGKSPERKKVHEDLVAALAVRDSFGERMRPDAENPLTDDERKQFFESMQAIGSLMDKERRYIFEEVGEAYGENGEAFANYIQSIIDFTSPWPRRGNRPARGAGGPRGGGMRGGER